MIPDSTVQDNLRRVKEGARNTLVTINPDGTRSYKHDTVARGDGVIDTLRTDRGKGTTDSLDLLAKEGKVKTEGLLGRDPSTGKYASKGKRS